MIPLHTGDEICPSFAHARLAASVFVMAEASAKALSLAASSCFIFLVWSKLIVNNISPFVFSLWPGCPVLWWRVPLKNKALPPDTVGCDGSSRDNWRYAWGSWWFPGDVWIWELDWVRAGVWFFRAIPCKTINIFICINQYMQFAAFIISSLSLIAFIEPCFGQHFKHWQTQLRVPN